MSDPGSKSGMLYRFSDFRPHSSSVRKTVLWDRFSDSFPPGEAMGAFAPKKARRLSSPGFRVCQKSSCLPHSWGTPGWLLLPFGEFTFWQSVLFPVPKGPGGALHRRGCGLPHRHSLRSPRPAALAMTEEVGRWCGFARGAVVVSVRSAERRGRRSLR